MARTHHDDIEFDHSGSISAVDQIGVRNRLRSIGTERDDRDTLCIGNRQQLFKTEKDRAVSLEGQGRHPGFEHDPQRFGSNRRQLETRVLGGLRDLYQAGVSTAQPASPPHRRVGSLDRFDREHRARLDHHRLADVQPAQRLRDWPGECDVI